MKRNLSHLRFWCCCCHEKKKQRNKARKNSKKTRKVTKRNKRTRKDKKKGTRERERERERDREWKRRSEWSQGERKWDTEEVNKNNPFSGENSVFVNRQTKKQKEKKGLGPTAPKHTCRVASTQTQEENAEKSKTQKEERGVSKELFSNSQKRCRKKSPGKLGKKHPHRSRKQISGNGPNRTQTTTQLCAGKRAKNFTNWSPPGKNGKNVISKRPQFCSPRPFFAFQTQFGQKFELPKKTNLRDPQKLFSKNLCSIEAIQRVQRKWTRHHKAKLLRNPLFSSVSRPATSWTVPRRPQTRNTRKKRKFFRTAKNDVDDLQMAFLKNPKKSENSEETWFPETAKNRFRATKTVVSKRGGGKWTLGGRKWTLETRFWGAANEPNSIYIYIHIYAVVFNFGALFLRQ